MSENTEQVDRPSAPESAQPPEPSNPVYARVGEEIRKAAHDGVQRGLTAQDIIREIALVHGVHMNVGELRLLLATRRAQPEK